MFICCEQCYKELLDIDEQAAHVWVQLCGLFARHLGDLCFPVEPPALRILEVNRFILTTETDSHIHVRSLWSFLDSDKRPCFCKMRGRHPE
jgi:hypothetical protein